MLSNIKKDPVGYFCKDKSGRIVIWQKPNIALSGWIIFEILALILPVGNYKNGSRQLSTAFIFVWAFMELTTGLNKFRKALGLIVLIIVIAKFFY